nr:reverse transcriptase domain-containing protein [Tanacetum cinerariifolium]
MITRSSARNLFPPLDNPELTIRRRSRADPTLLNDFEMAAEGNGDPPVPNLRTMEELCQPSLNGRNSCQFHGLSSDDANKHLGKFLHVTQSIKMNGVTDDALHLYLFPHSLTHHATAWFDRLPRNSINTFEQMAKMFLGKYFPPSMVTKLKNEITNFLQRPDESLFKAWERYKLSINRYHNHNMLPVTQVDTFYNGLTLRHRDTINAAAGGTFMKRRLEECYDLIENMTAHNNDWDTSAQRSESSSSITSSFDTEIAALKAEMAEINKNPMRVIQVNQQVKAVTPNYETCSGPHSFNDCPATVGNTQNVYAAGAYQGKRCHSQEYANQHDFIDNSNLELKNMFGQFMKMNTASSSGSRTLPDNTITNPKEEFKVEREAEATKDTVHPTNNGSTKDVQPSVVQTKSPILNSEPVIAPIIEPDVAPVSALKPNQRSSIPYPSRLHDQKLRDKANDQREKFFQIFKDLNFNISFSDDLILMPKFGPSIKSLLTNKDKLCELARTSLNEHCSTILLKELPEKLGDPGKFLIPCDFPGMAECLALADLGASVNLMPLFVWNKLSLPDLSPTCMTLELVDRLISRPVGVAEDVFVKVGTFHFPTDFVVVDFDADPRVPLILGRSFLKTERALIDVFECELTLRVGKEVITFNLDQTSRYSANYNDMTANRIDVIDMSCEEYSQEVLDFSDVIASGNPTLYYDPIVSTTSPTLTPFKNSDFLLEEVDAFLALEDDPTSREVDHSYFDSKGDNLLLDAFLNDDPSLPPPNQGNYLPQDLPPHLEYAFLEGDDKLPVIIAKDLSVKEKSALITVLKSHKRAIYWKLSDINGIDPEICTHKILMEDDFEPAVQHQRRVNPKIHDVINNEVLKLLDVGLIYPIFDSPLVSPVHCVPKKGGFTVVENEENELILTRLVMRWHVCIDYRKLNEATRKDHFPLPFMDQMLERLAGNKYYCFLDGFSVIFKFPSIRKIRKRPHSRVLTEHLPIVACLLGYAMHQARFRGEKIHFMVKEGIVLGHKISKNGIEVDKAKVDVIAKLPHPTTVKGIRSFLGHAGFYRHFIKDFSKIARPMTRLFEKDTPFFFSKECVEAFQTLKRKITKAPILIAPTEIFPLSLCTMQVTLLLEMLAVVYAFKKFRSYLIMNKSIMYTDHSALKYLFAKKDSKARLLRWVLLLQEFTFKVIDTKGVENLATDHLSRLENPHQNVLDPKEINRSFSLETLNMVSFRAYKTPIGCTTYKLVYGKACHLPIELEHKAYSALKHANFDLQTAGDHKKVQLNELNELCDHAYENSLIYKEKTKRLHDSKIKDRVFNIGDRVLLFNSRLEIFSGKLKSRWSRPFTISHVFPYGTIELSQPFPKMVVLDLQTFPKDQ